MTGTDTDEQNEDAVRVPAWIRCAGPVRVTSMEAARTILRMHQQCSGEVCRARRSGLQFIADVTEPDGGGRSRERSRPLRHVDDNQRERE